MYIVCLNIVISPICVYVDCILRTPLEAGISLTVNCALRVQEYWAAISPVQKFLWWGKHLHLIRFGKSKMGVRSTAMEVQAVLKSWQCLCLCIAETGAVWESLSMLEVEGTGTAEMSGQWWIEICCLDIVALGFVLQRKRRSWMFAVWFPKEMRHGWWYSACACAFPNNWWLIGAEPKGGAEGLTPYAVCVMAPISFVKMGCWKKTLKEKMVKERLVWIWHLIGVAVSLGEFRGNRKSKRERRS